MTGSVPDKVRFGIGLIGLASISVVLWSLVWALVAPVFFGWSPIAVTSGSMEPLIATGDIVFVSSSDGRDLAPGTVIVFDDAASGGRVTHRIVDVTPDGDYVTRGDANGRLDSTPVAPDQVAGVGRMIIPALGLPIVWVEQGEWFLLALAVMAMFAATTASRWALLGRFSPWRTRSLVPPTPASTPAAEPAAAPGHRRRAPVLIGVALGVLAAVGVSTVQTRAAFVGATDNSADVVTADTLQPPTAVLATGGATVTLDWTITPDTYADGHTIYRGTAPGGPYLRAGTTSPHATSTFVDFPRNGTYYYVARAAAGNWESIDSNEDGATVVGADDYDAVAPGSDNCPALFNVDQFDSDGDGVGDACDASPTVASSGVFTTTGQALGVAKSLDVGAGDLDGDGDLDLIYSNEGAANTVWLNDGSGTFTDSGQALGAGSDALALGDFDGDGDLDVTFSRKGADSVFVNDGSGTFTDSGQAVGTDDTKDVAVGDFDGDGDLDIVAANKGADKIWLNNGTGTFTDSGQVLGTDESGGIAVGAVDANATLDLAFSGKNDGSMYGNTGTGTFTDSGQVLDNGDAIAVGDVDGDGDLDIVYSTKDATGNTIWFNDGIGGFTAGPQDLPGDVRGLALGDLDGDGDHDLAYAVRAASNTVYLNDGLGTFTDSGQAYDPLDSYAVAAADFDGDGDLDLAYANDGANSVWINDAGPTDDYDAIPAGSDNCPATFNVDQFDTDGDGIGDACDSSPTVVSNGTFTDSGQTLASGDTGGVVFADVDGDGDLDAMTSNGGANRVWLNDGSGTFTDSGQALGNGDGEGLAMADVDGDGDIDAMTADDGQANRLWLNDGTGTFTDSGQALDPGDSWGVAFGDFDGDDDLDAIVANNGQPNTIWLNDGSGAFTDSGQTLGSGTTKHVVVGDVDGDGDLDAVDANNGANRVWLNNGSGTFTDSGQALGSATTIGVALADVDADGDADVVFANNGANRVWLNNGSGTFTDSGQTLGGATSDVVVLGDLDGDGDIDAMFGNGGASRVWLNDGAGTFTDSGQSLGSATTQSMALGDFDGDGDLDAYFGNGGANTVWVNDTGPPIGLADAWQTGLTHVAGAGPERMLVFVATNEQQSLTAPTLTGVTYGGEPLTFVMADEVGDGCCNVRAEIWVLKEGGVALASNSTLVPTWSSAPNTPLYSHVILENVDQLAPFGAQTSASVIGDTPNPVPMSPVVTSSGDMVLAVAVAGEAGTYTPQNGFTPGVNQSTTTGGTTASGTAQKVATGADETVSMLFNPAAPPWTNRQVAMALVLQAAP